MSKSRFGAARCQVAGAADRCRGAVALICIGAASIGSASSAGTASGGRTTIILGQTPETPNASCPETPCRAVGSVTGFQIRNEEGNLPFRVPRNGEITAWTITLSQPTPRQRAFFNGFFGRPPEAHLAILKRVPGTHPPRYRLRRQSPVEVLTPYLGQTVRFKLAKPLPVRRATSSRLTIPTWAPAFAVRPPRGQRLAGEPRAGHVHQPHRPPPGQAAAGRRQQAQLRLPLQGARLLYTATFVAGR